MPGIEIQICIRADCDIPEFVVNNDRIFHNIIEAGGSDYITNIVKDKKIYKAKILVKYIEAYFFDNGGKC